MDRIPLQWAGMSGCGNDSSTEGQWAAMGRTLEGRLTSLSASADHSCVLTEKSNEAGISMSWMSGILGDPQAPHLLCHLGQPCQKGETEEENQEYIRRCLISRKLLRQILLEHRHSIRLHCPALHNAKAVNAAETTWPAKSKIASSTGKVCCTLF